MRTRPFGPAATWVPVIGQGTWNLEQGDRALAVRALRRGFDLGLTHVDTAELYGQGEAERIVGEAIAGRRDQLFLVSKVLPSNASYEGTLRACEASLERLGTDRLDAYLLHWPGSHPLERTVAAFERLVADGKIRAWGVSNFDVGQLEEARRVAGPGRLACNQVLYHLGARYIEGELLAWCAREAVAVVGYSPFGSGDFPAASSPQGRVLQRIAAHHRATPRQIALAFLLRGEDVFVIPKAATVAHVEENAQAAELALSAEEVRRLSEAFPRDEAQTSLPVI